MKLSLQAFAALFLIASPHALAQDPTPLFEDFENGIPAGWSAGSTANVAWHAAPNGQCGAVTGMVAFNRAPVACDYSGASQPEYATLQSAEFVASAYPPFKLAFDYILDIDPTGDSLAISINNSSGIEMLFASHADLVNDGMLHSIVLETPVPSTFFPTIVRFHFGTDGVGDQGRGLLLDNIRYSSSPQGTITCHGGTDSVCPCANGSGTQSGCANSTGAGAKLIGSGVASVSADTLQLGVLDLPANSSAVWFGGTTQARYPFGNGRRCVRGSMVRLGQKSSVSGNAVVPEPGERRIASVSQVPAGATRYYQVIYRDAAGPCGQAFNLSNGWEVTWAP